MPPNLLLTNNILWKRFPMSSFIQFSFLGKEESRGLSVSEMDCLQYTLLCPRVMVVRLQSQWANIPHPFPNILAGLLIRYTDLFEFHLFFSYSEFHCEVLLISKITKSWISKRKKFRILKTTKWIINRNWVRWRELPHPPNHLFDVLFFSLFSQYFERIIQKIKLICYFCHNI